MIEQRERLPLPNPEDWTDVAGAAEILRRNRSTVYDMADRGLFREYVIGSKRLFWVPELKEVADALGRVGR